MNLKTNYTCSTDFLKLNFYVYSVSASDDLLALKKPCNLIALGFKLVKVLIC